MTVSVILILDLHVGHVGGKVQKNILSVILWAPADVDEKHCLVCPERLVASQEYLVFLPLNPLKRYCIWYLSRGSLAIPLEYLKCKKNMPVRNKNLKQN